MTFIKDKKIWFLKTVLIASLCLGLGLMLAGCGSSEDGTQPTESEDMVTGADQEPVSRDFFAMDTYMTVTAYGENADQATQQAEAEVNRLDAMLSTGNKKSEIGEVNANSGGTLSEEAGALVERGLELYDETDHQFDIAIYPIMEAWGFTDKNYQVPPDKELKELLALTDADEVTCEETEDGVEVSFARDDMAIDLGGIAKGYTSSRIMEIYKECGITSGLVSLGGNVQVLGTKPDGSNWRVAIQDPGNPGGESDDAEAAVQYMGILEAADIAVITSGAYERNFTEDGVLYHHIIDPATGKPANNGLRSVTIIAEDGTLADALSTSLYIMGKDKALDYWRSHADQFDCILMDDSGELYVTKPVADKFISDTYHITVVE